LLVSSVMSSFLLLRSHVAVLPADSIGPHRVGVYLRLMNKAAVNAPQGHRVQRSNPVRLRQCAEPLRATGIWDNEAAPPREVIGYMLADRANMLPLDEAETLPNSLSPLGVDGRPVIIAVCRLGSAARFGSNPEELRSSITLPLCAPDTGHCAEL
jgi:hypothetical protein